jgi:hypothetical protein
MCICAPAESADTHLPTEKCVWGVATFKNQLYVGRSKSQNIEIYDVVSLALQRNLTVPRLGCLADLASRTGSDVMYVADLCSKAIHVINEDGVRSRFAVSEKPVAVSVLPLTSNVLVTFENADYLYEYTPEGEMVGTISLPDDIEIPNHAIRLPDNRTIIAHESSRANGLHRVCEIDGEGRIVQCFGAERGVGG